MSKKTVAQLDEEFQQLKDNSSNVQLEHVTVWHWEQVAVELEKYNRYGELIKMEITKGTPQGSNRCYHLMIWHRPLLNPSARANGGDYYEGIRRTMDKLS